MTQTELQAAIDDLCRLLSQGKIKAPPAKYYKLEQAAAAHRDMESGAFAGRLVLRP
jgi:NADPH:quinone reductase-like Zn-dependent oxidoreductase